MKLNGLRIQVKFPILGVYIIITACYVADLYPVETNRLQTHFSQINSLLSAIFHQQNEQASSEIRVRKEKALSIILSKHLSIWGITAVSNIQKTTASGKAVNWTQVNFFKNPITW